MGFVWGASMVEAGALVLHNLLQAPIDITILAMKIELSTAFLVQECH
jgi:hypothetical protein